MRPLLFSLTLHQYCQHLYSELCISYLDDVTIGGSCTNILQDIAVMSEAEYVGLTLNVPKSDISMQDQTTLGTLLSSLPHARLVDPADATPLSSPLDDG